jgi:hypothetical protein
MKHGAILILMTVCLAVLGSGCALFVVGAAAGAGGYVYTSGELKSTEATTYEKAFSAAELGLKERGYTVTNTETGRDKTHLIARGPGDEKVTVMVRKVSGTAAEIGVRVGTFGDQARSTRIMDQIKTHL